ncbi:hypothetical protein AC1031_013032 [Aphanomyces cochlioides]|nr:hypothetical protein AC1031_013032 [Aphanomyces cochlioides]
MSDTITAPSAFNKIWNTTDAFDGLLLQFPGRVFVSWDSSIDTTAIATVATDSNAILDLLSFNVSTATDDEILVGCNQHFVIDHPDQTYLNISATSNEDVRAVGTLLLHVVVKKPLSWIKSFAETVINNGALINGPTKHVSIASLGSGNVSASVRYPVTLANLTLTSVGAGSVQFNAASTLNAKELISIAVTGEGAVALQASDLKTKGLHTSVSGAGSAFVTALNSINASEVHSTVAGDGEVNYYPSGKTINNTITISGNGVANTGSLLAQNASVVVSGKGEAVVQVVDTLTASISGKGKVEYYNATVPAHVPKPSGWWLWSSPGALPTAVNSFDSFNFTADPADVPVNVSIELNRSRFSHCIAQHFETDVSLSATPATTTDLMSISVFALVAFVVAFIIMKSKRRNGYTALPK